MNETAYRVLVVSLLAGICVGMKEGALIVAAFVAMGIGVLLIVCRTVAGFRLGMKEASREGKGDR